MEGRFLPRLQQRLSITYHSNIAGFVTNYGSGYYCELGEKGGRQIERRYLYRSVKINDFDIHLLKVTLQHDNSCAYLHGRSCVRFNRIKNLCSNICYIIPMCLCFFLYKQVICWRKSKLTKQLWALKHQKKVIWQKF